jgi:hypothetical protein
MRAELAVELQFYGLLDRMMPYYAQEQIGVALMKSACDTPGTTRRALQTAVAQARALVFDMGSTTPWLTDEFQDLRYVITDRVVNGAPMWAAEGGEWFMYRAGAGTMQISNCACGTCAAGEAILEIYNTVQSPNILAPTQLPSHKWLSIKTATLGPQYASARHNYVVSASDSDSDSDPDSESVWVPVPDMRVTAVHGLDDAEPAMAAALRQLAALTAAV